MDSSSTMEEEKDEATAHSANTHEDDDLVAHSGFIWRVDDFSKLNTTKCAVFNALENAWSVLIFLKEENAKFLSLYLCVADPDSLPDGWSKDVKLTFAMVNQIHGTSRIIKDFQHKFCSENCSWGFDEFLPLSELSDSDRGYIMNDTCIIEVGMEASRVSEKETGYVGLKNQGATCYMNSILQSLYHLPYFRKVVHTIPTNDHDPSKSLLLALQILFYKLQHSSIAIATEEFTLSLGWNKLDSVAQGDIHEFNKLFCQELYSKMEGTVVKGELSKLFEGNLIDYTKCTNAEHKSEKVESFSDLHLVVRGCKDVYASFDKFVEQEVVKGNNQNDSKDVVKTLKFIDFPQVLQLHLRRFEFDSIDSTPKKINDYYEFPQQLDLDIEDFKYLSKDAAGRVRNLYTERGHYRAYIRPTLSEQWFEFNDERVTKVDSEDALEAQFGGQVLSSNAYMLMYVRECNKKILFCHVDDKNVQDHVKIMVKKDQQKSVEKAKEKVEEHLDSTVKVAHVQDLVPHIMRPIGEEDVHLCLIAYDDYKNQERIVGMMCAKWSQKPINILTKWKEMAGFAEFQGIDLYKIENTDAIYIMKSDEAPNGPNGMQDNDLFDFGPTNFIGKPEFRDADRRVRRVTRVTRVRRVRRVRRMRRRYSQIIINMPLEIRTQEMTPPPVGTWWRRSDKVLSLFLALIASVFSIFNVYAYLAYHYHKA